MNRKRRSNRRALRMEALEGRDLMAGDVGVSMFGGALLIEGDAQGNGVGGERHARREAMGGNQHELRDERH